MFIGWSNIFFSKNAYSCHLSTFPSGFTPLFIYESSLHVKSINSFWQTGPQTPACLWPFSFAGGAVFHTRAFAQVGHRFPPDSHVVWTCANAEKRSLAFPSCSPMVLVFTVKYRTEPHFILRVMRGGAQTCFLVAQQPPQPRGLPLRPPLPSRPERCCALAPAPCCL